jgi:hypothetical protein
MYGSGSGRPKTNGSYRSGFGSGTLVSTSGTYIVQKKKNCFLHVVNENQKLEG